MNLLLSVLFLGLGVSGLARACRLVPPSPSLAALVCVMRPHLFPSAILDPLLPAFITARIKKYHLQLTVTHPNQKKGTCG